MILVGQYDSPFVRRVAVALNHYSMPFERRILSVFQDFDAVLALNPLGKVPILILPEGGHLYDSRAILEYLEGIAKPGQYLTPANEERRCEMLRLEAVGIGLAEKIYERGIETNRRSPGSQDPVWITRLERQIETSLLWLEMQSQSNWLIGEGITRADLAVATAATYVVEKLPHLFDPKRLPQVDAHRRRCEALPAFMGAAYSASEALATGWRPSAQNR